MSLKKEDTIAAQNRGFRGKSDVKEHRINEHIRSDKVRLVGDGEPQIVSLEEALGKAETDELDLVEIAVNDGMSVVKIMDYAKFRFEQMKKAKEAKKKQRIIHVKEVKIRPSIDDHDYQHKIKHARSFIEKGDKVKFTMMFRGREIVHTHIGMELMKRVEAELSDCAAVEKAPSLEGKNITMILASGGPGASKKIK